MVKRLLTRCRLLLIEPYGIETRLCFCYSVDVRCLLIEPYGIETKAVCPVFERHVPLLIEPYGIETYETDNISVCQTLF